jgi:hypothetical protein
MIDGVLKCDVCAEPLAAFDALQELATDAIASLDALREDCPHEARTCYVGCGGMAYWICDGCERVVGKKFKYIEPPPKCYVCGKEAPGASPHIKPGRPGRFYCEEHMPDHSDYYTVGQ